ncbi:MAG TPA: hypothetical protein DEO83_06220 [Lachnospiraceae bacterium]|nr:hypothetical protein [Lachnospiraceae bacterium]
MKSQNIKNLILIMSALLITAAAVWLPGFLMKKNMEVQLTDIQNVPPDYYNGPSDVIIKNASKQLNYSQRLQLILGLWESTISETDEDLCLLSEFGIKNLVVNRVEDLYSKQLYPSSISSDKNNWFTWTAKPYKALDTTFHTYAAVYWDLTFTKFDNSEIHRFIVTESGDILYAEAYYSDKKDISAFKPKMSNSSYLFYYYGEYMSTIYNTEAQRIVEHDSFTTAFRMSSATDAELEKLDTSHASSFITDFNTFTPDHVYNVYQSVSGGGNNSMGFYTSFKTTKNTYQMLVLPK